MHNCAASEPKSPSRWAPVETMLRRLLCARRSAKGHDGQLGRGCWACARDDWSGWVLSEYRQAGRDTRNECGVWFTEYLSTQKAIYILWCTRRPHGMYRSRMQLCATAGRLGTLWSTTVGLCWTGVAGVGTLARRHCLLSTSIPTSRNWHVTPGAGGSVASFSAFCRHSNMVDTDTCSNKKSLSAITSRF